MSSHNRSRSSGMTPLGPDVDAFWYYTDKVAQLDISFEVSGWVPLDQRAKMVPQMKYRTTANLEEESWQKLAELRRGGGWEEYYLTLLPWQVRASHDAFRDTPGEIYTRHALLYEVPLWHRVEFVFETAIIDLRPGSNLRGVSAMMGVYDNTLYVVKDVQ